MCKRQARLHTIIGLLFIGGAVVLPNAAKSADTIIVTVQNTTGLIASDLHVTFTGTGGNITVPPATVAAPGCPPPAVPSNGAVTNTAVIDWGVPCIMPGAVVTFLATTTNGPLAMDSGFWTLGGVNIGPIRKGGPNPWPPPPPPNPRWKLRYQVKCVPLGRAMYTPWRRHPNGLCWIRWCCIPRTQYWYRPIAYFYPNRRARVLNRFPICVPIGPWRRDGFRRAKYRWRITTKKPAELNVPRGPNNPQGPPKNSPMPRGMTPPYMYGNMLAKSEGQVDNWQPTSDFVQSFFDVFVDLSIEDDGTPDIVTFPQTLMRMAPGYQAASQRLMPLITEIQDVLAFEPDPILSQLLDHLVQIQTAFQQIGAAMAGGSAGPLPPYQSVRDAFLAMSQTLDAIGEPRFMNASDYAFECCRAWGVAANRVQLGLVTDDQRNEFLWALLQHFQPMLDELAGAFDAHARIRFNVGSYQYNSSSVDTGVQVVVSDAATGEFLESMNLSASDLDDFVLPLMPFDPGLHPNLHVAFQFDSFLPAGVVIPNQDGHVTSPVAMFNGDVNADGVINSVDTAQIQADIGMGGLAAPFVPPTDVNNDGIVNVLDLNIALANLGRQSIEFMTLEGHITTEAYDGEIEGRPFEMQIRNPGSEIPIEIEIVQLDLVGVYGKMTSVLPGPKDVSVKGSNTLRRTVLHNFQLPNSLNVLDFLLIPGDLDDDNEINLVDFGMLASSFGAVPGDLNYIEEADLNGDLEVNLVDFGIQSAHFGETGDP